jgi:hypothetical protein
VIVVIPESEGDPMRRLSFPPLLVTVVLILGSAPPALAQEPTPDIFPYVPDPALCTVEPIDRNILLNLWFPEDGTPVPPGVIVSTSSEVTLPLGPAAGAETIAGVTDTLYGFYNCVAAADFTRYLVYFTDDMIRRFGPDPFPSRAACIGYLDAYPDPTPSTNPARIWDITNVMTLGEGRAAAFVADNGRAGTFTTYVIFEQQDDGRWLVDEIYQFPPC